MENETQTKIPRLVKSSANYSMNRNLTRKQFQLVSTLHWVEENYEKSDGICLPRCVLYQHYLEYCRNLSWTPAGPASFGKILRQKFPKLTTRRLGTRGQSKYHYYGIGIKPSSRYYQQVYTGRGLTRFSGGQIKTEVNSRKHTLTSKVGTILPALIESTDINISKCDLAPEKLHTFLMMYRTHCQRILDTVISASFQDVQKFMMHFWQGMPEHLFRLLDHDVVTYSIAASDIIIYKVLMDVLIPTTIQDIPESLGNDIRNFLKNLPIWFNKALEGISPKLRNIKFEIVRSFIKSIRRQLSFVSLAQTARDVLTSQDGVQRMIKDIKSVDILPLCQQLQYLFNGKEVKHGVYTAFQEFVNLISNHSTIEEFTEWIDTLTDRYLSPNEACTDQRCFFLAWSYISALVMKDLTLQSAPSFGSYHLIKMMCDEYIYLVLETRSAKQYESWIMNQLGTFVCNPATIKNRMNRPLNNIQKPVQVMMTCNQAIGDPGQQSWRPAKYAETSTEFPTQQRPNDINGDESHAYNESFQNIQNNCYSSDGRYFVNSACATNMMNIS